MSVSRTKSASLARRRLISGVISGANAPGSRILAKKCDQSAIWQVMSCRMSMHYFTPSALARKALFVGAFGAAALVLGAGAALADAQGEPPTSAEWDTLANCVSSERWDANTGNGYEGGLQILPDTWELFGGHEFADHAYDATPGQQKVIAERIWTIEGWEAWPNCARILGLLDRDVTGSTIQGVDEDDPNLPDVTTTTATDSSVATTTAVPTETTTDVTEDTEVTVGSLTTEVDDSTTSVATTDAVATTEVAGGGASTTSEGAAPAGEGGSDDDSSSIVPLLLGVAGLLAVVAILFSVLGAPRRKPPVFDPNLFDPEPAVDPAAAWKAPDAAATTAAGAAAATARSVPEAVAAVSSGEVSSKSPDEVSAEDAVVDPPTVIAAAAPVVAAAASEPEAEHEDRSTPVAPVSARPAVTPARSEFSTDLEGRAATAFAEAHDLSTEAALLRVQADEIRARQEISRTRAARIERAARLADEQGRPMQGRTAAVAEAIEEVSDQRTEAARLSSEADRLDQLQETARRRGTRLLERSRSL